MSGDVQPRKRKDKKKKKDGSSSERSKAEAEFIARKLSLGDESDEGFAPTKASSSSPSSSHFSEGDSIIHVHHEGGTGGHWCAKIVFFLLLGALVFVIGLILIENRGLTDLDTPVAESRYAQVFDGWVDEGPVHDDHHDEHTLELKDAEDSHEDEHDDDHDDEIEDIEDEHPDSDNEIDHSDEDDATDSDQENDVEENEEQDVEDSGENHNLSNEDPNDSDEEDDDDDDDIAEADDDDDDDIANNEDDDDEYLNGSPEDQNDDVDSVEDASKLEDSSENDVQLPFEEVDSTEEEVVENNVGEEEHIAAKQAEQLAQEQEESGKGKPSGGNAVEDSEPEEWLGDSNDDWKQQLDLAQAEMDEGLFD